MTIKYEGQPLDKFTIEVKRQKQSRLGKLLRFYPQYVTFYMSPKEEPRIPEDVISRTRTDDSNMMLTLKGAEINRDKVCKKNGIEWVPSPIPHEEIIQTQNPLNARP